MIVNLGEEYLPSKFFSCLRLVRTFTIYLSIKWLFWPEMLNISEIVSGRTAFYKTIIIHIDSREVRKWLELRFCLDGRFQLGLDWTRLGLPVLFMTSNAGLAYKSIPKLDSGRALSSLHAP